MGTFATKLVISTDIEDSQIYQFDLLASEAIDLLISFSQRNKEKLADAINFCLSIKKSNLSTECSLKSNYDALMFALTN